MRIVAVVNGDVISNVDVDDRARLFALSTGQPLTPDVLDRLRPQISRQLVDELLQLQEIQRRKIVIQDKQIAEAIRLDRERNGMPPGALRQRLAADGIGLRTLVDQIRTQLGWLQVVRQQLGDAGRGSPPPPWRSGSARWRSRPASRNTRSPRSSSRSRIRPAPPTPQRFADTVITELRAGAPFPVVASQFSQSQSALEGGQLGWVQPNRLDPEVARVVAEMPVGAVSNPIKVPGGLVVVTLQGKRADRAGHRHRGDGAPAVPAVHQPAQSAAPTAQQRQTLDKARAISARVNSCPQMEQVAVQDHSPRPADLGQVDLDHVQPITFRQMLAGLPLDKATQPVVAPDGIAVLIVCSRDRKNLAQLTPQEIRMQLLSQRVDLLSRQLQQDLRSQAQIEMRGTA